MLPGVAKIIFVDEGSPDFGSNLSEIHVLLIFMKEVILRARLTVGGDFLPILHQKLMKVRMGPAHRDLEDMMQLAKGQTAWHDNLTQDSLVRYLLDFIWRV